MKTLIWFRDDLRTQDHEALQTAVTRGSEGTAAVFIATPDTWITHGVGTPRISFTLATLKSLQRDLAELGIPLIFESASTYSNVPRILEALVRTHHIDEVHAGLEYGVDEVARDRAVAKALKQLNSTLVLSDTQTILPVYEIKNKSGSPYKVFTPFRRAWEEKFMNTRQDPTNEPCKATPLAVQTSDIPDAFVGYETWTSTVPWQAGQEAGLSRLEDFIQSERADRYGTNRDRPDI
ncbi:MAG TPA: hypothetical protein DCX60_09205, partial [Phycisphaerales bacterium]|nr:hypothetical protein [Phycisphaerales bacterium]